MKHSSFLFFVAIVLAVYTALNYYYLKRTAQALHGSGLTETVTIGILICLAIAFPLGRIVEAYVSNSLTRFFMIAGSFYLAFFFYALLATILVDIIRLGCFILHFLPYRFPEFSTRILNDAWYTFAGCIIAALCIGHWIASNPLLKTIDITLSKKCSSIDMLTIAAISDIHFGRIIGEKHLVKIEKLVAAARPDVVFLAGDMFDEDISQSQRRQMADFLKKLSCTTGVYAISGNHDYVSGLPKFIDAMHEAGVVLLMDTTVTIQNAFFLIGRKDLSCRRFNDKRKSLNEILGNADRRLPLILMDHQPFHLEEAQTNGIDLQLSGHTHHGQLFPLNLLYRWLYEKSWGYIRKEKTQVVVSCGAGTWGPPVRTNSIPEVLKIIVKFVPEPAIPPVKTQ
jgi:uncharacterized protein